MLNSANELEFSNESNDEVISQFASLALAGDPGSSEKNSVHLPPKTGYSDSIDVLW